MLINPDLMVGITEANQNFSKIAKLVDEKKRIVIMKNNRPKYVVVDFDEFVKLQDYYSKNLKDKEKIL